MSDGHRLVHFGTLELENVGRFAAGDAHLIRPGADAGLRVEDEAGGAGDHIKLAINTIVEFVADSGLFMAKIAVFPRTMLTGLRRLCRQETKKPLTTLSLFLRDAFY